MKTIRQLEVLFSQAKGGAYYSFNDFHRDAKSFIRAIKRGEFVCSMEVSRSGMMRKFNTVGHNCFLNICYNQKMSHDPVKVGGCGMNMHWYLLWTACEAVCSKRDLERYNFNSQCSRQPVL